MESVLRLAVCLTSVISALAIRVDRTPMLMPGAAPKTPDTYLCYAMKLNGNVNQNLVGFLPNVSHSVHHMILYGCPEPGSQERVWNCGSEMQQQHAGHEMGEEPVDTSPVCESDEKILYAWAHNAPNFELPEGVGFEVGGESPIQYLVVQLHYNDHTDEFKKGKKDHSGLTLLHTMDELPRQAGIIVMMSNGRIPAKHGETVDIACPLMEYSELHPFAYRTHTHKLGSVVSGYVIQDGKWQLLGKRDPQTPQMFYPVADDKLIIKPGDTLAARCIYSNPTDHAVNMGSTMADEMCNFYLMYWTEAPYSPIEQDTCLSVGPPLFYWETYGLKDVPADSSKL